MYKQGRLKHKGRDYANSVSALVPIFVSLILVLEVIMALHWEKKILGNSVAIYHNFLFYMNYQSADYYCLKKKLKLNN